MDEDEIPTGLSSREMLKQWNLKDVGSWGPIKRGNENLRALGCLHPPLIRIRNSDGVAVTLSKPVMVVYIIPSKSKVRTYEHNGSETTRADSETKSSDMQATQPISQQIIVEEEPTDLSSESSSSDGEHVRRTQRSGKREGQRQSSDKNSKSHTVRHSKIRLSSPERGLSTRRTLSPEPIYQAGPRDGGHRRRESRPQVAREHEQINLQSRRSSAVDLESGGQHVVRKRSFDIEEIQPEEVLIAPSYNRDTSGTTSPVGGRRTPTAAARQLRRESSRSREKRLSIVAQDGHAASPSSISLPMPPANSNPGVWSTLKQKVTTSGPWRNPG